MIADTRPLAYRPDIDGLRALAVGLVILNHAGLGPFPGGYVGVDVFFVISGFLITGLIVDALDRGTFSFRDFYERRARRILPALLALIAATTLFFAAVLPPTELAAYARTLPPAVLFYANQHMARLGGYFGTGTQDVPLLHLWSVAVEEQFYIVFPLVCLALHRWIGLRLRHILLLAAATLYLYAGWRMQISPLKSYFGTPERAWELLLGATIRLYPLPATLAALPARLARHVDAALATLGLALILAAAIVFDDTTGVPGFWALLPTAGAALVIVAGRSGARGPARLLTAPPVVTLGRQSYSLYLWHWPILVGAGVFMDESLPVGVRMGLVGLIVIIAAASHRFIETPFRRPDGPVPLRHFVGAAAATIAVLALGYAGLATTAGLAFRLPVEVTARAAALRDDLAWIRACRTQVSPDGRTTPCTIGATVPPYDLVFAGDSHAGALALGFVSPSQSRFKSLAMDWMPGCPPLDAIKAMSPGLEAEPAGTRRCRSTASARADVIISGALSDRVVVSAHWSGYRDAQFGVVSGDPEGNAWVFAELRRYLERLVSAGRTVVVVGPVPVYPRSTARQYERAALGLPARTTLSRAAYEATNAAVLPALHALESIPGVTVVYPHQVLCDATTCHAITDGTPFYYDEHHLSRFGAARVAPLIEAAFAEMSATAAHGTPQP